MNWGHKLTIGMISFMLFISTMVYLMINSKVDLVDNDYYESGIEYESKIKKISNVKEKGKEVTFTYDAQRKQLIFTLPSSEITGSITLYRPSEKKYDFKKSIQSGKNIIELSDKPTGLWKTQLEWKEGVEDYYQEREFICN